jgi:hypothetical protein
MIAHATDLVLQSLIFSSGALQQKLSSMLTDFLHALFAYGRGDDEQAQEIGTTSLLLHQFIDVSAEIMHLLRNTSKTPGEPDGEEEKEPE